MTEDTWPSREPEVSSLSMRGPHIAVLLALTGLFGCSDECDCPLGVTCDAEGKCQLACTQDSDCGPLACADDDPCCSGLATCVANECMPETVPDQFCGPPPAISDGWQAPVGSGEVYLLTELEVATGCPEDAPCPNALRGLEEILQSLFRDKIEGGDARVLVEVTGRQRDRDDFDASLTLRLFRGEDADEPRVSSNDFGPIVGSDTCCEFVVPANGGPRGDARLLEHPAQLRRGRLSMLGSASSMVLPVSASAGVYRPLSFHKAEVQLQVAANGDFNRLELWGGLRPHELWQIPASFCVDAPPSAAFCPRSLPPGATFLDALIAAAGSPDADNDGDGLECLLDTDDDGALDRCCEGDSGHECTPGCSPIPPVHTSAASSCALSDALADTYTVGLRGRLIPATLLSNR